LRLLAVERLLRGLLVLLAGYGVFKFKDNRNAIQKAFDEDIPLIKPLANKFHWNIEDSSMVHTIRTVLEARTNTLTWVAFGLVVYGVLQLVEATGLWLVKRWGEYFAVVATSLGLPIEIYELSEKVTWLRVGALVINVAAVVYLLGTKRTFLRWRSPRCRRNWTARRSRHKAPHTAADSPKPGSLFGHERPPASRRGRRAGPQSA